MNWIVAFAVAVCGQSVELPKEIAAGVGEWIVVPAKVDGGAPKWRLGAGLVEVKLDALFAEDVLTKAKGRVVKASKPGVYIVEAWNAKASVASEISTCRITIGTPPAPDPVDPKPPGPTPDQTPKKLFVGIWEESSQRTPAIAAAIDVARSRSIEKKHPFQLFEYDRAAPADLAKWKPALDKAGNKPPMLILMDAGGNVLSATPLPAAADVGPLFVKHGG